MQGLEDCWSTPNVSDAVFRELGLCKANQCFALWWARLSFHKRSQIVRLDIGWTLEPGLSGSLLDPAFVARHVAAR
jgi:hypothetical protein